MDIIEAQGTSKMGQFSPCVSAEKIQILIENFRKFQVLKESLDNLKFYDENIWN